MTDKERQRYLKAHNRCVVCGKKDERTISGKTCCQPCAEKKRIYAFNRSRDETVRECNARTSNLRYHRLIAERKCTNCGKPLEKNNIKKQCSACRSRRAEQYRKRIEFKYDSTTFI